MPRGGVPFKVLVLSALIVGAPARWAHRFVPSPAAAHRPLGRPDSATTHAPLPLSPRAGAQSAAATSYGRKAAYSPEAAAHETFVTATREQRAPGSPARYLWASNSKCRHESGRSGGKICAAKGIGRVNSGRQTRSGADGNGAGSRMRGCCWQGAHTPVPAISVHESRFTPRQVLICPGSSSLISSYPGSAAQGP